MQDDKTATMPIDMLSHIYWVCSRFFWGEIWKCTQRLNTPTGYTGGLVRLELVQEVSGVPTASTVVDGQQLTFPYQLDIIGAPGVAEGTLYLSEQQSDGSYQELGHYPLTFEKAE